MSIVTPVFNFNGKCEEAIELYKKAFHAKLTILLRYADAKKEDLNQPLTDEEKNKIYHSELYIGDQRIMLSDNLDYKFTNSTSLFLTVTLETPDEVKEAYELLKDDSTIIYPVHSTTYSSCLFSLIDKFGFRWGVMTETA
ncbi:MAG: hypothetical protein K0S41_2318 [Anaerocolumna sp.]|jgi:PhnB protein|nr:hypothetical protein [Anaerocolumna sp.]